MTHLKKILVIDDDDAMRSAIKRLIRLAFPAVQVIETSRSENVIKLLMTSRPSAVILDIMMPELNGLQILQTIREFDSPWLKSIPVIVLSGVGNQEVLNRAKELGAVDYLTKPYNEKVLTAMLEKLLNIKTKVQL